MHGKPTSAATASASSIVWAIPERAVSRPIFHCDIETATVFGFINRIGGGANHGHAEFSQTPDAPARARSSAPSGRPWSAAPHPGALFDDFTHHFPVNRLDVGGIGHFRVGHDGRRVRVHRDNAVALFAQRFTRPGAGVVKLTRLTDNNRARAQNQDTFMSVRFGIALLLLIISRTDGIAQLTR